jgi:hypothetical protein
MQSWPTQIHATWKQRDTYSCGYAVCAFAQRLAYGKSLTADVALATWVEHMAGTFQRAAHWAAQSNAATSGAVTHVPVMPASAGPNDGTNPLSTGSRSMSHSATSSISNKRSHWTAQSGDNTTASSPSTSATNNDNNNNNNNRSSNSNSNSNSNSTTGDSRVVKRNNNESDGSPSDSSNSHNSSVASAAPVTTTAVTTISATAAAAATAASSTAPPAPGVPTGTSTRSSAAAAAPTTTSITGTATSAGTPTAKRIAKFFDIAAESALPLENMREAVQVHQLVYRYVRAGCA